MIEIPSVVTPVLMRAFADSFANFDVAPPADAQQNKLSLTKAEIEALTLGVADGYFRFPTSTPGTALVVLPACTANTANNDFAARVTGFKRCRHQESPSVNWNVVGEVLYEGTVGKNTATVPSWTSADVAEPLYLSRGLWTMTHGSTANLIQPTVANGKFNSPLIVPVNGCWIIRVQVWEVSVAAPDGLINALVGAY